MLVTLQEIIQKAEEGNYAVPAFNVYNTTCSAIFSIIWLNILKPSVLY